MTDSSQHNEAFLRLARYLELIDESQASACLQMCHSSGKPAEQVAIETQLLKAIDIQEVEGHMAAALTIHSPPPDGPIIGTQSITQEIQQVAPPGDEDSTATRAANTQLGTRATVNPRARSPASDPDARPVTLGRYQLGGLLGRGGMGSVYQAYDDALDRAVAVKMITPGGATPEMLTRFQREARAVASMGQHPNIVGVHDFGQQEDTHYIVMDLVRGGDLEAWLAQPSLSQRKIVQTITEAARGVGHAHTCKIIHRDLKPANILMTEDGRPKVSDFGLARNLKESASLTADGQVMGTPAYMAPEQAGAHAGQLTPATDVFALGVLLYETLTHSHPFIQDTVQATMLAVLHHLPPAPRELNPRIPPDLNTIIIHCLRKNPSKRYLDANALAADLGRFLAGEAITARPLTQRERAGRWYRRNQRVALPGLIVTSLAIALGGGGLSSAHLTRKAEHADALKKAKDDFHQARSRFLKAHAADPDHCFEAGVGFLWQAEKVLALDPSDAGLRQATYEAANSMAKAASQSEQWDLARIALGWAERTGVDPKATGQRLKTLKAQREAAKRRHTDAVSGILEQSRSGELAKTSQGEQEALFELIRHGTPETVDLMVAVLDAATTTLLAASSQSLREANELTVAERAVGLETIAHLEDAVEALGRLDPESSLTETQALAVLKAGQRLEQRNTSHNSTVSSRSASQPFRIILASAQTAALGDHEASTTRLCLNALSRIDLPERTTPVMARFLLVHWDQQAAAQAGLALCRTLGPKAATTIRSALGRFGWEGLFRQRVCPTLIQLLGSVNDGASKEDLLFRAQLAVQTANFAEGQALAKQALAFDEDDPDGLTVLATALRAQGGLKRASELLARVLDQKLTTKQEAAALLQNAAAKIVALQQELRRDRPAGSPPGAAAQKLTRKGLMDLARAATLAPWKGYIPLHQGMFHQSMGEPQKAIAAYTRATAVEPDLAVAWYYLGAIYQAQNQLDAATKAYTQAISLDADMAQPWFKRAEIHSGLGAHQKAVADASRALALQPDYHDARIVRARAYVELGAPVLAQRDLDPILPSQSTSAEGWTPQHLEALGLQSHIHTLNENYPAAISCLERAIEAEAANHLLAKPQLATLWRLLAQARESLGQLNAAISAYNEAINLEPQNPHHWNMRALANLARANPQAALKDISQAIQLRPKAASLYLAKGNIWRLAGQPAKALELYDAAIRLEQDLPMAWCWKGWIHMRQGDLAQARECLEKARELAPHRASIWQGLGALEMRSGNPQLALSHLNEALKRQPHLLEALFFRAKALAELGDPDGARKDLRQVVQRGAGRPGLVAKAQKMLTALESR